MGDPCPHSAKSARTFAADQARCGIIQSYKKGVLQALTTDVCMLTDDGPVHRVAVVWSRRCSAQALNPQKSKADPTESGP